MALQTFYENVAVSLRYPLLTLIEEMIHLWNLHHVAPFQRHVLGTVAGSEDVLQVDGDFLLVAAGLEAIDGDVGVVREFHGRISQLNGLGQGFQKRKMIDCVGAPAKDLKAKPAGALLRDENARHPLEILVGAGLEQKGFYFGGLVPLRQIGQWRQALVIGLVGVGMVIQELFDQIHLAAADHAGQRRLSIPVRQVGIGPVSQQDFELLRRVTVDLQHPEQGSVEILNHTVPVGNKPRVGIRVGRQQRFHFVGPVPLNGLLQREHAGKDVAPTDAV